MQRGERAYGRIGAGDESGGLRGEGQGRADHPRSQRHDRPLQGPSGPPDGCCRPRKRRICPRASTPGASGRTMRRRRSATPSTIPTADATASRRCTEGSPWTGQIDVDRDQGPGCDQRLRRRGLEPARSPGHQERDPDGRAHEHVRARPAVRASQSGECREECRPDAGPDRHDVQFPQVAAGEPLHGHGSRRRARRGVRLPDDYVQRLHRRTGVPIQGRQAAARGLHLRRERVQGGRDAAGLRPRAGAQARPGLRDPPGEHGQAGRGDPLPSAAWRS